MIDIHAHISNNEHLSLFQWQPIIVNHTINNPKINFNIEYQNGIYIYLNQKQQVLYVGESRRLNGRLLDHFNELHSKVKKGYQHYCDFFQEYQDEKMIILTTQIDDIQQRKIAEDYLTVFLQTEFIRYKFNKLFDFHILKKA